MTDETKSDGMTLKEIHDRLWASRGLGGIELGNDEFEQILSSLDHLAAQSAMRAPAINIKCETKGPNATGTTTLNVVRVEQQDDGSYTAVTDYWPERSAMRVDEAMVERAWLAMVLEDPDCVMDMRRANLSTAIQAAIGGKE